MIENRILELLTRKLAGEINAEELKELKDLMASFSESAQLQEMTSAIWDHEMEEVDVNATYQNHLLNYQHDFQPERKEFYPFVTLADQRPFMLKYRSLIVTGLSLLAFAALCYLFFSRNG